MGCLREVPWSRIPAPASLTGSHQDRGLRVPSKGGGGRAFFRATRQSRSKTDFGSLVASQAAKRVTPAPRALVLDGHSRAAVETVQSLGRRGVVVHVAAETSDSLAFRSSYPERRFRQPSQASVPSFVD